MSATSAIAALQTNYPIPPATTYVDTESSVTILFTGWNERTGAIDFILNVALNDHSCTQLAFGHDLDADGDLASEETELVIGYDCGNWFTRDELHGLCREEMANVDPSTSTVSFDSSVDLDLRRVYARVGGHLVLMPEQACARGLRGRAAICRAGGGGCHPSAIGVSPYAGADHKGNQALRDRMRDGTLPSRRILLPAPLVIRESTRRS